MSDIEKLSQLKTKIEKLKQDKERARGALDELLKRIKAEFGCNSIREAKDMLKEMKEKLAVLEGKFKKDLAEFSTKWKDFLE